MTDIIICLECALFVTACILGFFTLVACVVYFISKVFSNFRGRN